MKDNYNKRKREKECVCRVTDLTDLADLANLANLDLVDLRVRVKLVRSVSRLVGHANIGGFSNTLQIQNINVPLLQPFSIFIFETVS